MGSAVIKPLTRRRGKIKTNDSVVNAQNANPQEDVGNCEPHVDYKIDSLHKPATYRNVHNKAKSVHSLPRFCINKCTSVKTPNPYDSDEEPSPIQLAVKPEIDTKESRGKELNTADKKESPPVGDAIEIPFLPVDCIDQPLTPPTVCKVLPTSPTQKASSILPCLPGNVSPNDEISEVSKASGKKSGVSDIRLAPEISFNQQDVSRDARTPSPEYDDLEDVKVINPNPLPPDHSLCSPLESSITKGSAAGDVGVSISKTDQPAPEREGEQRMEVDHVIFIKPSPSKEFASINFQGGDDPVQDIPFPAGALPDEEENNYQKDIDLDQKVPGTKHNPIKAKSEMCHNISRPHTEEPRCTSLSADGHNAHRNISSSAYVMYVKAATETGERKHFQEDNTLHSSDSFGDTLVSGSNMSSVTSFMKEAKPDGKTPSLNNPEVEEILKDGADFMDGLESSRKEKISPEGQMHEALYIRQGDVKRSESVSPNCGDTENINKDTTNSSSSSRTSFTKKSDIHLPDGHGTNSGSVFVAKLPVCSRLTNSLNRGNSSALSCSKLPDVSPQNGKTQNGIQEKSNSRPASPIEVPYSRARQSSRHSLHGNTGSGRPNSRLSSAKSSTSSSTQNQEDSRPVSATKTSSYSGLNQKSSRPNSARQSATALGDIAPRQPSGKLPPINATSNRTSSRPVSARVSPTHSDSLETHPRPHSGKKCTAMAELQSKLSRDSFNGSRPLSGEDKHYQLQHLGSGQKNDDFGQTLANFEGGLPHQGDGEHHSERKMLRKDSFGESHTQPLPSITKNWTATPPPSFTGTDECDDHRGEGDFRENYSEGELPWSSQLPPANTSATNVGDSENEEVGSQRNTSSRAENEQGHVQSQPETPSAGLPERNGDPANASQVLENGEITQKLYEQPTSLSQEVIGHIRQQLYEEGLKPAERDGGVSFFIPVTEDGLQPQSTSDFIKEKLTRSKKASLTYEERMILANINRQNQLSKRKEFAVKDLQNVRGATSSGSESSDRIKHEDDFDAEFDNCF